MADAFDNAVTIFTAAKSDYDNLAARKQHLQDQRAAAALELNALASQLVEAKARLLLARDDLRTIINQL